MFIYRTSYTNVCIRSLVYILTLHDSAGPENLAGNSNAQETMNTTGHQSLVSLTIP